MQNQDQFSQQTIVVKDGVGTIVNPIELPMFDYDFPPDGPSDSLLASAEADFEERVKAYNDFEQYAKDNSFSTDAVDGEYKGIEFGKSIAQGLYGTMWQEISFATYARYKKFGQGEYIMTDARIYRPFIANDQPTAPTTTEGNPYDPIKEPSSHRFWNDKQPTHPHVEQTEQQPTNEAIAFADWLNNNWLIPSEDGFWRMDVKHIEFQNSLKIEDTFYDTEELYKLFKQGIGEF